MNTLTSYQLEALADKVAAMVSPVMGLKKAAEMLGISEEALKMRIRRGKVPCHKMGRNIYVSLYEINKAIGREAANIHTT